MAVLNSDAPEFFPTRLNKLATFPLAISSQSHPYHFVFSSSLFREPYLPFYYYPTATSTVPYLTTTSFHPNHHQQLNNTSTLMPMLRSEAKPTQDKPSGLETHELQQQQEGENGNGSKGIVEKQVFKILSSGGRTEGRGCDGFKLQWKKKEPSKEVSEEEKYYDRRRFIKNNRQRQVVVHEQQHFRSFPSVKKRGAYFPVVPVRPDGDETTVMIKNIPSKYTREMLVQFLDDHCMVENARDNDNAPLAFDFVYLPIDFGTGMNKGYAFVNFTRPNAAWKFLLTASNRKWELFLSHKIREVVVARIQGKEKLERHFETMNFPCESEDVLPVCFSPPRDGATKGGNQRTLGKLLFERGNRF